MAFPPEYLKILVNSRENHPFIQTATYSLFTKGTWGGVAGHLDQCPLANVCHGEALPWPTLQGHVGIRVPPGCILVVRKGMYGGAARVAPEVEGVAHVVEWRQVGEYAAVTDFMWLRRMNLVLDDPKKEGKGMCPCHQV